jgi:RimJ/RimL family protein N-acetyltransferase
VVPSPERSQAVRRPEAFRGSRYGPSVPGPEERTDRLTIEPLRPQHAEELHAALADPAVHRFIGTSGPWTVEAVRARLERVAAGPPAGSSEVWLNYAVRREARLVGRLESTVHGRLAEIAYLFDPAVSGRGYATEAVQWLLGHLARGHGVTEAWATSDPGNGASVRLLRRTGFAQVDEVHPDVGSYDEGDLVFRRRLG